MYQTAVNILEATIGIQSNKAEILPVFPLKLAVESLLTDFRSVEEISYSNHMDGYITVEDAEGNLYYKWQETGAVFRGPVSRLREEASDPRYTLWGNQGFLYRYALYLLEKKHGIHNFHACALYREDRDALYVIIGGAGSGKTVYLLSGIEKGLKLFATETVHFRMDKDEIIWFRGSTVDNVRYGTLVHDFPRFLPPGNLPDRRDIWQKKTAIELSAFCTQKDSIKNPRSVHILFPRIEKGFERTVWNPVEDKKRAAKILFDNVTEKLAQTILLYDKLTVLGLDEKNLAEKRWQTVQKLASHDRVAEISAVLSNPKECWGNILK